jgi:phage I-like protein
VQVIPFTTLSSAVASDEPPKEFKIFSAGKVETTKGTFTFDDVAAKSVMAEYAKHGTDLMIDYDHASLADAAIDPALAGKAAGWFDLELRNGELWAVNVRWTPAAEAALRAKEWRYTSPAFALDKGRVTRLLNVAITNLPATRRLDPLMAASAGKKTIMASDSGLSPKLVSAALAAVASKDAKGSLGVLQQILAALLGGSSDEAPPSSAAGGPPDSSAAPDPAAMAAASAARDAEVASLAGAGRVAMALTGKTDPAEALAELTRRSKVAVELENREVALSAIRKTDEAAERRTLVASLIKLGVEIPATAWADPAGSVPVERLNSEPIAEMRARVETLNTARGFARVTTPTPPGGSVSFGLTPEQLQICSEMKVDPETFAKLAAQRDAAKTGRN